MELNEIKERIYDYLSDLDSGGWVDLYNLCFNEEITDEDVMFNNEMVLKG